MQAALASLLSSEVASSEDDPAEEEEDSSRGLAEIQRTWSVRWRHSSAPPSMRSWYWPAGHHACRFRKGHSRHGRHGVVQPSYKIGQARPCEGRRPSSSFRRGTLCTYSGAQGPAKRRARPFTVWALAAPCRFSEHGMALDSSAVSCLSCQIGAHLQYSIGLRFTGRLRSSSGAPVGGS